MTDDFLARLRADAADLPPVEVSPDRVFDHLARRRRRRLAGTTSALALVLGLVVVQPWAGERGTGDADLEQTWSVGTIDDPQALRCGLPLPVIEELDASVPLRFEPRIVGEDWSKVYATTDLPLPSEALAGAAVNRRDELWLAVELVNDSEDEFDAVLSGGHSWFTLADVFLVRDGQIEAQVGMSASLLSGAAAEPLTWPPGASKYVAGGGSIEPCASGEGTSTWIEAGDYELYVVVGIGMPSEAAQGLLQSAAGTDAWTALVGGPYPVTITDGTEVTDVVEAQWPGGVVPDADSFVCGSPMPVVDPFPDDLPLRLDAEIARGEDVFDLMGATDPADMVVDALQPLAGSALDIGRRFRVEVGVVNPSADTVVAGDWGDHALPDVWFVQDGQVVGYLAQDFVWGAMAPADSSPGYVAWSPGATLDRSFPHGEIRISCDGATVPPQGEYDVYVTVGVDPPAGTATLGGGGVVTEVSTAVTLVGGPFPVTVEGETRPEPAGWEVDQAQGRRPGLEDVQLDFGGFAALRLGSEVPAEPSGGDMIVWDGERCTGSEEQGRWVSAYPADQPDFEVVVRDGRVVRIELGSTIQTTHGVMLGTDLGTVRGRYVDLALLRPAGPDWPVDSWAITEDGATMVFDVAPSDTGPQGESWHEGTVVGIALVEGTEYDRPTTADICS